MNQGFTLLFLHDIVEETLDCKELTAGSTLFLPIPITGGLFSVGDGHAVQGDGEVGCPALECPLDLQFLLEKIFI
ncbi:MAG: acetamidase/formamidase family protein [Bacillota bacterium]